MTGREREYAALVRQRGRDMHACRIDREFSHLVEDHMFQLLIVYRSRKDVGLQRFARDAAVQEVLSAVRETTLNESRAEFLDLVAAESRTLR